MYKAVPLFTSNSSSESKHLTILTKEKDFLIRNAPDLNEPHYEKTGLPEFRPGPTQTGLYSHRRWLETRNFVFRKERDCTIRVAKTKALISFAVTAKLICVFVFAYAKSRFSHDVAHMRKVFATWLMNIRVIQNAPIRHSANT